jgi:hypothetical protein
MKAAYRLLADALLPVTVVVNRYRFTNASASSRTFRRTYDLAHTPAAPDRDPCGLHPPLTQ